MLIVGRTSDPTVNVRKLKGVCGTPGDGPYIALELDLDTETSIVTGCRFGSNGCPGARQAARAVGDFSVGRTIEQLSKLDAHDLELIAGPLPDGHGHYYEKAIAALANAISQLDSLGTEKP